MRLDAMRGGARLLLFVLGISTAALARPAAADEAAFIRALADQAIATLSDKSVSLAQRERKFSRLLREGFAMRRIGRFVVGRYWKSMSPDQKVEYQKLFEEWVLKSYSVRLGGYNGQRFEIDRTVPAGKKDVFVRTRIVQDGSAPVRGDWRVRKFDGQYKVIDVVIEGVSMLSTQRAEFTAVLRKRGPDGLIEALQTRLSKYAASSG